VSVAVHFVGAVSGLKSLFGVSDAVAKLNAGRFRDFVLSCDELPAGCAKQACMGFNGPAFKGLSAATLSTADLEHAQSHLRILCGLYGPLRPMDLIQPYRLEMGTKGKWDGGAHSTLYSYWGSSIADEICEQMGGRGLLVNCASEEYSKSLLPHLREREGITVIDCVFKDDGRIKSVYAKAARGMMTRHVIESRCEDLESLRAFCAAGYQFSESESTDLRLVFNRSKSAAAAAAAAAKETKTTKAAEKRKSQGVPGRKPSKARKSG
jgi:cytoplasmic iron level regulating protein YaaA (DUF328/UPF0246 family)